MTQLSGFRTSFICVYSAGVLSVVLMTVLMLANGYRLKKQHGPLPSPGILVPLGVPLFSPCSPVYVRWPVGFCYRAGLPVE